MLKTTTNLLGLFKKGKYRDSLKSVQLAIASGESVERWYRLKIRCELTIGKYEEAKNTYLDAIKKHPSSIHLRKLAREAYKFNGDQQSADRMYSEMDALIRRSAWRYSDSANSLVIGEMMMDVGADPRKVLELFFDEAKKKRSRNVDAYKASAELAFSKNDFPLAAKELAQALKWDAEDADLHFGLARAYASSNPKIATESLKKALELNPNHLKANLFECDNLIDRESYSSAIERCDKILKINPNHELAFAYKAVIANLLGKFEDEKKFYALAKKYYPKNPEVDHLIGRKLSQKYRFAEGAVYQKKAIENDSSYLPAQFQLSIDLLRLGKEDEGWKLANAYHDRDGYNVISHNLLQLHEKIKKFLDA